MLVDAYSKIKDFPYINLEYINSNYEIIDNKSKINFYLKESDNENLSFENNNI